MDVQGFDLIQQLCASQYLVRSLHVAAELGVADAVGEGGRSVDEIAGEVGADADALKRVLRLLESRGVFVLDCNLVGHVVQYPLIETSPEMSSDVRYQPSFHYALHSIELTPSVDGAVTR